MLADKMKSSAEVPPSMKTHDHQCIIDKRDDHDTESDSTKVNVRLQLNFSQANYFGGQTEQFRDMS